jgi:hypothetical protein
MRRDEDLLTYYRRDNRALARVSDHAVRDSIPLRDSCREKRGLKLRESEDRAHIRNIFPTKTYD